MFKYKPNLLYGDIFGDAYETAKTNYDNAHTMQLIEKIIVGYNITTAQPDDWATNYTAYFTRQGAANDENMCYVAVTGDTAPTWEQGKYYSFNADGTERFERSIEPDGTAYNLDHIKTEILTAVAIIQGKISISAYIGNIANMRTVSASANGAISTSANQYGYFEISNHFGRYNLLYRGFSGGKTYLTSLSATCESISQSEGKISKLVLSASSGSVIPSNSEIKIYGVRG